MPRRRAIVGGAARAEPVGPLGALVDAASQRLQIADPVAAVKWEAKADIEAPQRVDEILATVGTEANARGIDSGYVADIFRDQIHAT